MNKDFLEELDNLKEDYKKMGRRLDEMKAKYGWINDYHLVSHILAKLNVSYLETTIEDMNRETAIYVCKRREDGKIIIRLEEVSSYE